jgi:hypothetical protein
MVQGQRVWRACRLSLARLRQQSGIRADFEIKTALDVAEEKPDHTIFIIPLRLEPCNVPNRLQRWQWVDLFKGQGYAKLMASLRARYNPS